MKRHNQVVVKFKDNTILKGKMDNWSPQKTHVFLQTQDQGILNINKEKLKAVFFIKDFEGNPDYKETYDDLMPGEGRKMKVKFLDGEEIIGYCLSYSENHQGFTITPADKLCNNTRIFIIQSAIEKVEWIN
jgi:hypothetical protein